MGSLARTEATFTIVGAGVAVSVAVAAAAVMRRGAKAWTTSNRPKTLVSNICLTRVGSASIAGASYTGIFVG